MHEQAESLHRETFRNNSRLQSKRFNPIVELNDYEETY